MNCIMKSLISAILVTSAMLHAEETVNLESGFHNPPTASLPHTWWHWMNGNVTREGITTDLEAMKQAGLGGTTAFFLAGPHHQCDTPAGPVDYLSPAWLDMMKHAAAECDRLGLEFGMHNCAGWATTGGPWITPDLAMQKLVSAETVIDGDRAVRETLPQPEVTLDFYRDIAVFAIPAGLDPGPMLPKWESKAGQRGGPGGRQPDLRPLPAEDAIPHDEILDLTANLTPDATLVWDAPPGRWKIIRLGHTPTGATNKPAPASVTGLEIDKLRRDGLDVHWQHGIQPLLDHLGPHVGRSFTHLTIDSYEAGLHHWTPHMRREFQQRRGYDPQPWLLALTGRVIGDGPATERFLWDIRRTIADLFADHYYGYMAELCHRHGLLFTTEPYTTCFEGMQVGGMADIPMAEFFADGSYSFSVPLAASIAHTHGRPIAAAEAFTAGPNIGRWTNHPGSLRRVGDRMWAQGINRFVFHRYAHQPWPDLAPGMTMGQYGMHFERTNTWWEPGHAWLDYIARSQFLLQTGKPVSDVLCFAGNAAPNGAVVRKDLSDAGYGYDSCGTDLFMKLTVDQGDLMLPSGMRYRLLVLPDHPFHTPAFARKLRELVAAGATVLGPRPRHTPSLEDFPKSENEVRAIGEEVWGDCDGKAATTHRFGDGRVFTGVPPVAVLAEMGVAPAVQLPADIAWIHRQGNDTEVFFLSNQSDEPRRFTGGFRAAGRQPEIWDAERNTTHPTAGWTLDGSHARVPLVLEPGRSLFVVFRREATPHADPVACAEGPAADSPLPELVAADDGARLRAWTNGPHTLHHASGAQQVIEVDGLPAPLDLTGPWDVRFQAGRGAPEQARFDELTPWQEHADDGIRHFSGTAVYTLGFDRPHAPDHEVWLDLGEVAVIARVRLNGRDLGVLWHPPFRVEATAALQAGANTLEVEVTNLWVNRLIGDEKHPDDCEWDGKALARWPDWLHSGNPRPSPNRIAFTTWKHWTADEPLQPSGLLGPVVLKTAKQILQN